MKLYHIAPMMLGVGSIILPGNWGRIISHPRRKHDSSYAREQALERTRRELFPNKPSRLNCVFALPNLAAVNSYRQLGTNCLSTVYEIQPVDINAPQHLGSWRLGRLDNGHLDLAPEYWSGFTVDIPQGSGEANQRVSLDDDCAEYLLSCGARVVRMIPDEELALCERDPR